MPRLLTGVQAEYLRLIRRRGTHADAAAALNERYGLTLSALQIRVYARNHGLKGFVRAPRPRLLTQEQHDYLRSIWPEGSRAESAARMNRRFGLDLTLGQIKAYAHNHGIFGAPPTRFAPGHNPVQHGRPGVSFSPDTEFKPGNIPANVKPLGHERISRGRVWIKVPERNPYTGAPTRYLDKARYVWAQAHGPVPAGQAVTFLDGDPGNCGLENLTLLPRAELLALNRWSPAGTGPEIQPVRIALARLRATAGQRACSGGNG